MHSRDGLLDPTSRHHAYIALWIGYSTHSRGRRCGCPCRRGRPTRPIPLRINSMERHLHLTFQYVFLYPLILLRIARIHTICESISRYRRLVSLARRVHLVLLLVFFNLRSSQQTCMRMSHTLLLFPLERSVPYTVACGQRKFKRRSTCDLVTFLLRGTYLSVSYGTNMAKRWHLGC